MKTFKAHFLLNTFALTTFLVFISMNTSFAQLEKTIIPAKDNTLVETTDGSLSNGMGDFVHVGRTGQNEGGTRRIVMQFALSDSLPSDAVVDSVALVLQFSAASSTVATPINLHRLENNWGEGTSDAPQGEGQGAPSEPGDATWIHTFYDTATWTNVGGDYNLVSSASTTVGGDSVPYTWTDAQMVADVNSWLANPDSNFGWIFIGDESDKATAKKFGSRSNSNTELRPTLYIRYTSSASIEKGLTDVSLSTYPNPASENINIKWESQKVMKPVLTLIDVMGREVWSKTSAGLFSSGQMTIPVAHLAKGRYYLSLRTEEGKITRSVVID